jgi:hypothetical protein
MMMLLGRYSRLLLDSWMRPTHARLNGCKAADRTPLMGASSVAGSVASTTSSGSAETTFRSGRIGRTTRSSAQWRSASARPTRRRAPPLVPTCPGRRAQDRREGLRDRHPDQQRRVEQLRHDRPDAGWASRDLVPARRRHDSCRPEAAGGRMGSSWYDPTSGTDRAVKGSPFAAGRSLDLTARLTTITRGIATGSWC